MDMYDFVVVGPSALAVGPSILRGAKHRGIVLRHVLQINTSSLNFVQNGGKNWIFNDRQKGFSRRPEKVHFWKIQFQNLL